ncbi:MAG: ABC transporter ATP-binding protein [Chitinophagales bacterium]
MIREAVHIERLGFSYSHHSNFSIENLSMIVGEGERFGLFGPNGAGKTTLMSLMTGLNKYKKGSIRLLGEEIGAHKRTISTLFGFVPQDFSFYQELSPEENLEFFGAWYGLKPPEIKKRTQELMHILGLEDYHDKRVKTFSGGMKRRVNLAIAVIHRPKILFLDEPTVGVDVQTRHAIISYLKALNQSGTTLIYTSHQLQEAEELCQRIALIDEGKIIVHDDMDKLLSDHRQEGLEGLFLNLTGKAFRD